MPAPSNETTLPAGSAAEEAPVASSAKVACSSCNLRRLCLPVQLSGSEISRLGALVTTRRNIRRGQMLFRARDPFRAVYAIRAGSFKTRTATGAGREQVTGFHTSGELLGLDGIGAERHCCDAIALEDSQVCTIPYDTLEALAREFPLLQRQLHRVMSLEIVRDHGVMLMLGSMRAEERLASFLLSTARRLQARGFSASEFVLRMTREEIGSYLGLKLETISRAFSHLHENGILEVNQRHIRILDSGALQALLVPAP